MPVPINLKGYTRIGRGVIMEGNLREQNIGMQMIIGRQNKGGRCMKRAARPPNRGSTPRARSPIPRSGARTASSCSRNAFLNYHQKARCTLAAWRCGSRGRSPPLGPSSRRRGSSQRDCSLCVRYESKRIAGRCFSNTPMMVRGRSNGTIQRYFRWK